MGAHSTIEVSYRKALELYFRNQKPGRKKLEEWLDKICDGHLYNVIVVDEDKAEGDGLAENCLDMYEREYGTDYRD